MGVEGIIVLALAANGVQHARAEHVHEPQAGCHEIRIEGEVSAGQTFFAPLGQGLAFYMQPIAAGWILRVIPASGPDNLPDYAELATPPYNSVTPLSLSTDFSFRAQDAIGWNPRRFRFAADRAAYDRILEAYRQLPLNGGSPTAQVESVLTEGASTGIPAEFRILDASLVPGTADQWRSAAAVSSHFSETPHTSLVPVDGRSSGLGRLEKVRFQLLVDLPVSFKQDSRWQRPGKCTMFR